MFGYGHARTLRKKLKRSESQQKQQNRGYDLGEPQRIQEATEKYKQELNKGGQEGIERKKKQYEEFNKRKYEGLSPEERNSMQYEANRLINQNLEGSTRQLQAQQRGHGITGRGGLGFAQQHMLQQQAEEGKGLAQREIEKENLKRQTQNKANAIAMELGGESQGVLQQQHASELARLEEETKKNRPFISNYSQRFNRIG